MAGLNWLAMPARPQSSNGSLRGTVQDQTKAVIPGVTVLLANEATGVEFKTVSNDAGLYVFPAIVPGTYRMTAEHPGMAKFEATASVEAQQSANVDIVLRPTGTQTTVSVQDLTPMVATDSAAQMHTLERTRIEQLPLNGRSIWGLLQTVPGMTTEGGRLRVYGLRQGTHDVILDGAALTDYLDGAGAVSRLPGLDSIQEFTVANNASSAKFTRPGTIIYLTKSGSNALHGSLFVTNRNSGYGVARARNNMTNVIPQLNRNEYGGTIGGPVWIPRLYNGKNRTFFFFSYEGYKLRQATYNLYRVPTEAMRNGDFSGLVNGAGTFFPIYNPWTTDPATFQRQPFNYGGTLNRIDPALVSPLAKYLYSVLPAPNITGANPLVTNNYSGLAPNTTDQSTWSLRFDQRFSDNDHFFVRMTDSLSNNYQPAANGVPMKDGFGNSVTTRYPNKSLATTWTHSFSPTLFSETMFSASRVLGSSFSGTPGIDYASQLGLPNPTAMGSYPVIADIGVSSGGNYVSPINWKMQWYNYFILEQNFTKVRGRHELQFGVHLRHDQLNSMPQHSYTAGGLTFPGSATGLYDPAVPNRTSGVPNTGHIAASAYLGLANYEYRVAKGMYYMRGWEDAQYFQDNVRLTSRLTLNLGVRWQITPYAKAKDNVFSSFDRKTMSIVLGRSLPDLYALGVTTPALVNILTAAGAKFARPEDVGMPSGLVNNEWRDIGPHLGFAYRALDGRKSFVIRGGYATTFFPLLIHGWADPMRANAPFSGTYYNNALTSSAQSPDGLPNYGLVNRPSIVAGQNSANAVSLTNPAGVTIGGDAFTETYFNTKYPSSRVYEWNLTLEKELMANTVARAAYVGNHGAYQETYDSLNASIPAYIWYMTRGTQYPTGTYASALVRPLDSAANPLLPYGDLQEFRKDGWTNANGLQLELERRYSRGYGFQLIYNMMNTFKAAGIGLAGVSAAVPPTWTYLPGAVPDDHQERMKLLLYQRDTLVPKHDVRWNWIADLPFGKGKPVGGHANAVLDAFIGGWQVAGMGRLFSNYFSLPANMFPVPGTKVEFYGHQYPIQDCRGGTCVPGYLLWNGYIPAYQINSSDASGKPNGIMGVPAGYKPAVQPLLPYPANYPSLNAKIDPMYPYYGGNNVWIPLKDGTVQRVAWGGLNPLINQPVLSTFLWNCDASLFKSFTLKERLKLRVQFDFFNVFNVAGDSPAAGANGIAATNTNANPSGPRVAQLSARLSW